jgi:hypothetical protein
MNIVKIMKSEDGALACKLDGVRVKGRKTLFYNINNKSEDKNHGHNLTFFIFLFSNSLPSFSYIHSIS